MHNIVEYSQKNLPVLDLSSMDVKKEDCKNLTLNETLSSPRA